MASELFQELPLTPDLNSFTTIIAPESFDNDNQIDFIFSLNNSDSDGSDSISAVDEDDNDGFRTPTSSLYKIPVVEQCPPAPRRPKPISWSLSRASTKRASGVRRGFSVYISDEIVESIFSSASFGSDFQKNKKARKNDNNGGEMKL